MRFEIKFSSTGRRTSTHGVLVLGLGEETKKTSRISLTKNELIV